MLRALSTYLHVYTRPPGRHGREDHEDDPIFSLEHVVETISTAIPLHGIGAEAAPMLYLRHRLNGSYTKNHQRGAYNVQLQHFPKNEPGMPRGETKESYGQSHDL
jgi:hypothetical protein